MAAIAQASLDGTIATGKRRGQTVMRMGIADEPDEHERKVPVRPRLCADVVGYNLHAGRRRYRLSLALAASAGPSCSHTCSRSISLSARTAALA